MSKGQHYARSNYTSKRTSSHSKLPLIIVAGIVVLAIIAAVVFIVPSCGDTKGTVKQGQQIDVVIPAGSSTDQIASILVNNGVVASKKEFIERAEKLGKAASLQSGSYVLTGGADIDSIVQTLVSGKTGRQLVIPEGYTLKQIAAEVEKTCGIDADEFYSLTQSASSYASDFSFLKGVYNNSMEGFLYPDTYRVETYATADDVIRMMLKQFQTKIATVDMSYAASKNLTMFDIVTLSSIVEKEYEAESDKPLIAAVFYNRLHAGIVLGSDVTTYYAVGKDMTEELTAEDLASNSPYNTRNPSHYGLPAGPICSPSVSTIAATANPSQVDYLYFFFSKSKGQTMFFSNDADFNAAWAQYGD
jgi:UPF0755 protein